MNLGGMPTVDLIKAYTVSWLMKALLFTTVYTLNTCIYLMFYTYTDCIHIQTAQFKLLMVSIFIINLFTGA